MTAAIVVGAVAIFARDDFGTAAGAPERRQAFAFWPLLLALWAAINLILVANDLFTLYVGLELLTFAAMPLVCLDGSRATLDAALRYLMFALLGSVLYLLGVALIYGATGTLDIVLLRQRVTADAPVMLAIAVMTAGLLAKTALLPLHLWLPPAHAGAPAAGSAILSALVVKGSFVLLLRLWFGVMAAAADAGGGADPGRSGRRGHPARLRRGAAAGAAQAARRLLDRRADRLPVPDVPAAGGGARRRRDRRQGLDRRRDPGGLPCLRQGGDVPGRRHHGRALRA